MKLFFLLCIMFSSHLIAATSNFKGGGELLNSKASSVELETVLFQSNGQYDSDGTGTSFADGTSFSLMDVNLAVRYGVAKNLELGALGRFRNLSSSIDEVSLNNSGPESLGIEVKYAFPRVQKTSYALGLHYRQTLHTSASFDTSAQVPADTLVLGDSGSEYGVDLFVTNNSDSIKWDFKFGYSSPANNLSSEIRYQAQMMYLLSSFGLFAGAEGVSSLKNDEFTDLPTLKPYQATGATKLFNSMNREYFSPFLGINLSYDNFLFTLKGQTVIAGKSTDIGNSAIFGLSWRSKGITDESIKIDSFKEYIIDGSVLKVSARGNFIRIDQGLSTDVEKGMKFDVYQTDYFGGNVLVASGIIFDVGVDWSVIKLTKRYSEIEIKPGFAARGY